MGTIGTVGSYYQLSNLLTSGSGSSNTLGNASSVQQILANALASISSSSGTSSDPSAYLLDLSPQAQSLMGSMSSGSGSGSSSFTLTQTQQTAIKNILEKYKGEPLTQATFDSIQNALQAAGLSPQKLGAEDQITSFNGTNLLLQALSGYYASVSTPSTNASNEQTKESNYMQSVVSLWKELSAAASSASGASTATSSS